MAVAKNKPSSEQSLAELFHLVKSLIPDGQVVERVERHKTVAEAIALMRQYNYTQLPVVSGNAVLGVFSYRSLVSRLLELASVPKDFASLPVEEFTEEYQYVQPSQNWESILGHLNRDDAVLVGHRDDLQGILTPVDGLNYLHEIARPFVVLAEIEISLRRLIHACVDEETLEECVHASLAKHYEGRSLPSHLEDMTFNDYAQIICHGRNWSHFAPVFSTTEYQRNDAHQRLTLVRDLRNVVFHFKRPLTATEREQLVEQREWLERKTRGYEGQKRSAAVSRKEPPAKAEKKQWDELSFMEALLSRCGPDFAKVAKRLLAWAENNATYVSWGHGKISGSFVPVLVHEKRTHGLFAAWTNGRFEFYFGSYKHRPPFESEAKRRDLLEQFNAIDGIQLPADAVDGFPAIPLAVLEDAARYQQLLGVLEGVIAEILFS